MVVAALVLGSPDAFAAKPWGKVRPLNLDPQAAAIDERGFAIAVGERRRELVAARRTPRRSFGEPFAVAPDAITTPAIAFSDRTASILFQREERSVESRRVGSDGARTPRRLLSAEDDRRTAQRLSFSQLIDGPQLAWWTRPRHEYTDPALQIAGAGPTGLLPAAAYDYDLIAPAVAVEPDGRPLVAFADYIEGSYPGPITPLAVAIAHAGEDQSLAPSQYVARRPEVVYGLALDIASDGEAILAWERITGGGAEVLVSRRPPGGAFTPPKVLSRHERAVEQLTVAFTSDGDPLVGWLAREQDDCYFCSRLLLAEPGGKSSSVRLVSGAGGRVQRFALAVDGTGGATLAWTTDPRHPGDGLVSARAVTRRGRLGKIHRLNEGYARNRSLTLAVGPRGDALVAWPRESGAARAVRRPAGG